MNNNLRKGLCLTFLFLWTLAASAQIGLEDYYHYHLSSKYPAARAFIERPVIDIGFRDDFCTKEIMTKHIGFSYFRNSDILLADLSHCGYSKYGVLKMGLGYSRLFSKKLSIALCGIYLLNHAEHYENLHSFTIDFSACYRISSKFSLSIDLYNPIRMRYGITGNDIIPMSFALQATYHPSNKLLGYLYCTKHLPGELDIGLGLYYQPIKQCIIQGDCSIQKCGLCIHIPWKRLLFCIRADWYYRISLSTEGNIYFTI